MTAKEVAVLLADRFVEFVEKFVKADHRDRWVKRFAEVLNPSSGKKLHQVPLCNQWERGKVLDLVSNLMLHYDEKPDFIHQDTIKRSRQVQCNLIRGMNLVPDFEVQQEILETLEDPKTHPQQFCNCFANELKKKWSKIKKGEAR